MAADGPTLLVLAAGLGSRFGGLKQCEPMGPNGEPLLDYAVFDAHRAGFARVVFVIREDMANDFSAALISAELLEIDPDQPRIQCSWLSRFRHYTNLDLCEARLVKLIDEFSFTTMSAVLAGLSSSAAS